MYKVSSRYLTNVKFYPWPYSFLISIPGHSLLPLYTLPSRVHLLSKCELYRWFRVFTLVHKLNFQALVRYSNCLLGASIWMITISKAKIISPSYSSLILFAHVQNVKVTFWPFPLLLPLSLTDSFFTTLFASILSMLIQNLYTSCRNEIMTIQLFLLTLVYYH